MKSEWRSAVKEVMYQATLVESGRANGVGPTFNYRWEHVQAVVTLARRLTEMTGADEEIVGAAAWLHDVTKSVDGEAHANTGADYARAFLPQTDFPAGKINAVAQAIAEHKGLWREEPLIELESMVLWDADKLSKLGLTAAFHWTGWFISNGKAQTAADLIANGRGADWQAKTVASMHTRPAQQAARIRMEAFNRFWNRLEFELNGEDLIGGGERG